ncbi:VOC family protein [Paenibacillus sp. FSL K6-0108]|uniref:VOC family protein n=1 Tax=Paenibacillus sp. FSL K6-0108 TaxID=2921417 RepID=UPI003253940B
MTNFHVGHVGINVTSLERSIAFYTDVFGLVVKTASLEGPRKYAFLGKETGGDLITLWEQSEGRFSTNTPGLHHLAFEVDSIEEVQRFEGRLKEARTPFLYDNIVMHEEGSKSGGIFFEDPDGVRLEIFTANGAQNHGSVAEHGGPSCGFF